MFYKHLHFSNNVFTPQNYLATNSGDRDEGTEEKLGYTLEISQ